MTIHRHPIVSRFAVTVSRFAADTRGATAIEYAMIAAGVGAAIAAVIINLGSSVKSNYDRVNTVF